MDANPRVIERDGARMEVAAVGRGDMQSVTIRAGAVSMRFVLAMDDVKFLFSVPAGEAEFMEKRVFAEAEIAPIYSIDPGAGFACPVAECPHAVRKAA